MVSKAVFDALPKERGGSLKPAILVFLRENSSTSFTRLGIKMGLGFDGVDEGQRRTYPLETELSELVKENAILEKPGPGTQPYYALP